MTTFTYGNDSEIVWVGILIGICFLYFQGYAWEITTVEGGYGLQDLLSSRKSVINGTCFYKPRLL